MNSKLLFRMDDICPGLKYDNLIRLESIFDQYGVKPLIGIVPFNEDEHLVVDDLRDDFWDEMRRLQNKGWSVALHGYKHIYVNECTGMLDANPFSEFAGVEYETQKRMIMEGKAELEKHGLNVHYFMAPGHTFDDNTLMALKEAGISGITDGYARQLYTLGGITFYPCTLSQVRVPAGLDTVCIHLNNWTDKEFDILETFLKSNSGCLIDFEEASKLKCVEYGYAIYKQELQYQKLRDKRQKAADSEVMQNYLQKSYSSNKYIKLIKRALLLPLLLKESVRNILKILLFLIILFISLRSFSYIMRTNGDVKNRFAGFYAEEKNSIDVLMFGSSTVGTSFIPAYMWDRYGFTSYALSSNSQRPKAIKYLIEEGLRYQNPKLVVIELRTFTVPDSEMALQEGHIREVVDDMKYSWHRIETINALTEEYEDKLSFYIDLMKYHSNIGMLRMPSEWTKFDFSHEDKLKGYELLDVIVQYRREMDNRAPGEYSYDRIAIPQDQEVILLELLEYLKEKDLQALFVVTPRDHEDEYEGNICYMSDIIKQYDFDVIDINERFLEAEIDYRVDMHEGAHTNVWGAVKVSDYIGKIICEQYLGDVEHSNSVIENWDNAYKIFNETYTATEPKEEYDE